MSETTPSSAALSETPKTAHEEDVADRFNAFVPGESDELITLESSDDSRSIAVKMINNCRRSLDIITRDLDPCIYNTGEMTDAVKKLALRSRYSRIRILIKQPKSVITHGHRFVDLSQRLSSFFEIRAIDEAHKNYNSSMLIVDDYGYILRPHADRFAGTACFNDRGTVSGLTKEFDALWEQAHEIPDFRALAI